METTPMPFWNKKNQYDTKAYPIKAVTIDLTEACNLQCSYPCFHFTNAMSGFKKKPGNLSPALGKRVLDWLFDDETSGKKPDPFLDISFWGGEPLLRWELLCELVEYAEVLSKKTGKKINLGGTTNATLFDKEKVDYCKKHNVRFLLSIDGPDFVHDIYRRQTNGKGSYELIEKNLDYILSTWEYISTRSSPAPNNIRYFAASIKYLYDRGFWNLSYSPAFEGDWTEDKLKIAQNQLIEIAEWVLQLRKQGKKIQIKHLDDGVNAIINQKHHKPRRPCGAGVHYVGVAVDGSLWSCHRLHHYLEGVSWKDNPYCLGHIDHGGITNFEWRRQFIDFVELLKEKNSKCGDCNYYKKTHCNGGCYATNFDHGGSIFSPPEIECRLAEMQYNASEYLLKRMKEENIPVPQ